MNWEIFYFVCFLVGILLSLVTFVAGSVHLHTPRGFHFHGAHGHAAAHGHAVGHHGHAGDRGSQISWFNFGTITAFLAWFGGTGYLLTRYSNVWVYLGLFVSAMSGLGGASVVVWFLMKLVRSDEHLDPADYQMVGVLGRVASPTPDGGPG